jgi:hypothetical protein
MLASQKLVGSLTSLRWLVEKTSLSRIGDLDCRQERGEFSDHLREAVAAQLSASLCCRGAYISRSERLGLVGLNLSKCLDHGSYTFPQLVLNQVLDVPGTKSTDWERANDLNLGISYCFHIK